MQCTHSNKDFECVVQTLNILVNYMLWSQMEFLRM